MTNKKEKTAIVLGATGNLAFALGIVLLGLKKYNQELLKSSDLFIYYQNFSEEDLKVLATILPATFLPYKLPQIEGFLPHAIKDYGEMTFVRYECFKYLSEYKNSFWLDTDIIIQGDISGMREVSTGIGFRREYYDERVGVNFTKPVDGFDMTAAHYNAGIMSISDVLPYEGLTEWCYKKTAELAGSLYYPDQGILLLMCEHFKFAITPLDEKFNCEARRSCAALKTAAIVHAVGHRKFWKYYYFKEWYWRYKEWLALGGSRCENNISFYKKTGLDKYPFFQVAPDPAKYPGKFLLYCLKGIF